MAVAIWGSSIEVVRGNARATANCPPILCQALSWLGAWNEERRLALVGDREDPVVERIYATLIAMARPFNDESLVKGFGNLGVDGSPPSWPNYVAFGVTEAGQKRADGLFQDHPSLTLEVDAGVRQPGFCRCCLRARESVILAPDVQCEFPDAESVNQALRSALKARDINGRE
jgi:hypothetical protein